MPPVVRKIPDPMTLPTTSRMAEPSPIARTSPSSGAPVPSASASGFPPWDAGTLSHFLRSPAAGARIRAEDRMAARLTSYLVVGIVAVTLIAGLIVRAQRDDNDGPVDLIVHNAVVFTGLTPHRTGEAVAVRANQILEVGATARSSGCSVRKRSCSMQRGRRCSPDSTTRTSISSKADCHSTASISPGPRRSKTRSLGYATGPSPILTNGG